MSEASEEKSARNYETDQSALKLRLTGSFLDVLVEAARVCGDEVDSVELRAFVGWCYDVVECERPDVTPYEYR